ncbi:MAG: hypothetical protein R3B57_08580 [Phycisphaerales bacterium]
MNAKSTSPEQSGKFSVLDRAWWTGQPSTREARLTERVALYEAALKRPDQIDKEMLALDFQSRHSIFRNWNPMSWHLLLPAIGVAAVVALMFNHGVLMIVIVGITSSGVLLWACRLRLLKSRTAAHLSRLECPDCAEPLDSVPDAIELDENRIGPSACPLCGVRWPRVPPTPYVRAASRDDG